MDHPTRATFLSPPDYRRLDWACRPIHEAWGSPPYLVGSVLTRPDFRDIDLRLILDDKTCKRLGTDDVRLLLNIALSDLIAKTAGLAWPVDFQIQARTEADSEDGGRRPMGLIRTP